jgi:hypothetical protein
LLASRGKELDIRKIAEMLGVRTVLERSGRRAGTRIRVTAQLITAEDGSHLSSERYDRELADVFALQDEIAVAIATALMIARRSSAGTFATSGFRPAAASSSCGTTRSIAVPELLVIVSS